MKNVILALILCASPTLAQDEIEQRRGMSLDSAATIVFAVSTVVALAESPTFRGWVKSTRHLGCLVAKRRLCGRPDASPSRPSRPEEVLVSIPEKSAEAPGSGDRL